jgi:hypothetical protein
MPASERFTPHAYQSIGWRIVCEDAASPKRPNQEQQPRSDGYVSARYDLADGQGRLEAFIALGRRTFRLS